jgi:hypothetical protein
MDPEDHHLHLDQRLDHPRKRPVCVDRLRNAGSSALADVLDFTLEGQAVQ